MKKLLLVPAVALAASIAPAAFGQDPAPRASTASSKGTIGTVAMSQQDKMRYCAKQATGKKGDERRTFMKGCLSKKKT